jgi:hypothetical protein
MQNKRNLIEDKYGEGKNGNSLNKLRAKLMDTEESWVVGIFCVMDHEDAVFTINVINLKLKYIIINC